MNLKEFSALLNLSPTTVSRALNGYPEVSEATRQRILEAAKEHHYRPSHYARTLAGGTTYTIGHIVARGSDQLIDPHYADFIAGATEIYSQNGYELSLAVVDEADEKGTYLNYIHTHKVDGIMVQSPTTDDWRITLLKENDFPFVVHGRSDELDTDYSFVDVNNRRAFRRATQYLLDLGHKRIALINGKKSLNFAQRRKEGFLSALTDNNSPVDARLCFADSMTEPHGYQAAKSALALDKSERPTAFLVSSILPALGAYRALHDLGLRMPQDISILIFDDNLSFLREDSQNISLFTSVRSRIYNHGKQAAKQLIEHINHPNKPPVQTIWDAELIIGRSTGIASND